MKANSVDVKGKECEAAIRYWQRMEVCHSKQHREVDHLGGAIVESSFISTEGYILPPKRCIYHYNILFDSTIVTHNVHVLHMYTVTMCMHGTMCMYMHIVYMCVC